MDTNIENKNVNELFDYILNMPDDMFKMIYPTAIEEFKKSVKSGEFEADFIKGVDSSSREQITHEIESLLDSLNSSENDLSKEKSMFIEEILKAENDILNKIPFRDTVNVEVVKLSDDIQIPQYAHPMDAGCDVYAAKAVEIPAYSTVIVPTGLKVAIPNGWMISVRPRSGLSTKTNLRVANAPGTIDSNYRGEIGIILHNTGSNTEHIEKGDRIAQFVIEQCPRINFKVVTSLDDTDRGEGGYGSSGN